MYYSRLPYVLNIPYLVIQYSRWQERCCIVGHPIRMNYSTPTSKMPGGYVVDLWDYILA